MKPVIPAVTAEQMATVDRIMIDELGVSVLQLMEVAGLAVAAFARDHMLRGDARGKRVLILCGTGGNGGDGLVAARFLHAWGAEVSVWLSQWPDPARGVAAHQLAIVERMAIPVRLAHGDIELPGSDLVIDALLGFSLSGAPSGSAAGLIRAANEHPAPVLSVDVPSGLMASTGEVMEPCIQARATLTLALPKKGLVEQDAATVTGALYVADIGVPPDVYRRFGIDPGPIFANSSVVAMVSTMRDDQPEIASQS